MYFVYFNIFLILLYFKIIDYVQCRRAALIGDVWPTDFSNKVLNKKRDAMARSSEWHGKKRTDKTYLPYKDYGIPILKLHFYSTDDNNMHVAGEPYKNRRAAS